MIAHAVGLGRWHQGHQAGDEVPGAEDERSFELNFSDEVFEELTCKLTLWDGQLRAVFRVKEPNTRRLLEAESGRLRNQLEARGLRGVEVVVETEEDSG